MNMYATTEQQMIAINTLERELGEVRGLLYGDERPGLVERLTALERGQQTQTWLLRATLGVCIGILIRQFVG